VTVFIREDINDDGLSDLLVSGVAMNLGVNEYAPPRQFRSIPFPPCRFSAGAECFADFDGDGSTDSVFSVSLSSSCNHPNGFVFLNDGHGNMTEQPGALIGLPPGPLYFTPGDFDLDGDLDIVVGGAGGPIGNLTNSDCFLENDGSAIFTVHQGRFTLFTDRAFALPAGDFDGDGDLDFVKFSTGMLGGFPTRVFLNDGSATFQHTQDIVSMWGLPIVRTGDFTGDGCADLLVSDAYGMPCRLLVGSPSGQILDETWRLPYGPGTIHGIADISDFDADGDLDIVAPERGTRPGAYRVVRFWENDGRGNFVDASDATVPVLGTEINPPLGNRFYDVWRLAAADHDGDGDDDVMVVPSFGAVGPAVGGFTLWNLTRHIETTGNPRVGQRDYGLAAYADRGHHILPLASLGRSILELPGLGTLQLDPNSIVVGPPLTTDIARTAFLPMPIPNSPSLAGARIYWQGLHVDPNSGTAHLTNGVVDTIQ
jgi:hypothetical protein